MCIAARQACIQKFLLGNSFERNVNLMQSPTAAKEHTISLYGVCIAHIHEGVISAPFTGALQNVH